MLFSKTETLVIWYFPFLNLITFVGHYYLINTLVCISKLYYFILLFYFLHPKFKTLKWFPISNIIDKHNPMRTLIIRRRDRPEPILTSGVPLKIFAYNVTTCIRTFLPLSYIFFIFYTNNTNILQNQHRLYCRMLLWNYYLRSASTCMICLLLNYLLSGFLAIFN